MRDHGDALDSAIPEVAAKRAGSGPVIAAGLAAHIDMARCPTRARETLSLCQRETGMAVTT
jgi:hypothetical protein